MRPGEGGGKWALSREKNVAQPLMGRKNLTAVGGRDGDGSFLPSLCWRCPLGWQAWATFALEPRVQLRPGAVKYTCGVGQPMPGRGREGLTLWSVCVGGVSLWDWIPTSILFPPQASSSSRQPGTPRHPCPGAPTGQAAVTRGSVLEHQPFPDLLPAPWDSGCPYAPIPALPAPAGGHLHGWERSLCAPPSPSFPPLPRTQSHWLCAQGSAAATSPALNYPEPPSYSSATNYFKRETLMLVLTPLSQG